MAEEVGSELVALISDHLSKVKQALQSRSNMDRTMKEEAIHSVSEIGTMLNRICGMFQRLESMLEKTLETAEKAKTRFYSEQLAASHCPMANQSKRIQTDAHSSDTFRPTFGLVVKAVDEKPSSHETKRLIKENVDSKALKLGVSKIKT